MSLSPSDVFAALALVVSLVAFWNAYLARRHTHVNDLDKQRRASLMKVRELEIQWQGVLNELYHFSFRVEKSASEVVKDSQFQWLAQVLPAFEASQKHVATMRQDLERGWK